VGKKVQPKEKRINGIIVCISPRKVQENIFKGIGVIFKRVLTGDMPKCSWVRLGWV